MLVGHHHVVAYMDVEANSIHCCRGKEAAHPHYQCLLDEDSNCKNKVRENLIAVN